MPLIEEMLEAYRYNCRIMYKRGTVVGYISYTLTLRGALGSNITSKEKEHINAILTNGYNNGTLGVPPHSIYYVELGKLEKVEEIKEIKDE